MAFLEIKNLSKKYNEQVVLDNVSYSFPSKGLFVLLGESGVGKSTFINCLAGIEKMDKGTILFNNQKIKNFEKFRNKYVGMIYQNSNLISFLSVVDNACLLTNKTKENLIDLSKFKNRKVNVLSGGENQRVAIARALSSSSKILLCDEPCGSLDKQNSMMILKILTELSKRSLVIMVTHNFELVKKFNPYIIKIENKQIVGSYYKDENNRFFSEKLRFLSITKIIKIAYRTLTKNLVKMITSIISLCISFSFLLFTNSASLNIGKMINDNKTRFLDYTLLKIVKEKKNIIENSSLTLVKEERLNKEDIMELSYLIKDLKSYHYDLTPVFSSFPLINHPANSEYFFSDVEWVPYYKNNEKNLKSYIDGRFPQNKNEVVINSEAKKHFSSSRFLINSTKEIDLKLTNNEIISDMFTVNMNFTIVGVIDEFELLPTPKIYYPYEYIHQISKEIYLSNLSKYYDTKITLFDRLSTICGIDDSFSSNKLLIECEVDEVDEIFKRVNSLIKEKEAYKVYSTPLSKINSFQGMFDSILVVLKIFLVITLLISIALLTLVIFSYILDYKKDIGIMLGCGVLKFDIGRVFLLQSFIITLISILGSVIVYSLFSKIINLYLFSLCGIAILADNIGLEGILSLLMVSITISIFISFVVVNRITKLNVSAILKED